MERHALTTTLHVDGAGCAAGGLALVVAAGSLAPLVGLTTVWPLRLAGVLLIGYGIENLLVARRPTHGALTTLIAADVGFAAVMLAFAIVDPIGSTSAVRATLVAVAIASLVMAAAKSAGRRRLAYPRRLPVAGRTPRGSIVRVAGEQVMTWQVITHDGNGRVTRAEEAEMARRGEHAIVLGASMAGLATAAVLAERFDRVTIIERDRLPAVGEPRKGVPQGRHVHALLPAGLEALTALFPGLVEDLCARGAYVLDPSRFRFHIGGGCIFPVDYERQVVDATRPLVEGIMRERVRELPGVRFVEGCDVRGLVTTPDRTRVVAVRLLSRVDSSAEETLAADLVVDATGRGSRSPRWLTDLGYTAPVEESVRVDVHYVTRMFRHQPTDLDGAQQVLVASATGQRRGGVAQVVEGDRWQVTLAGLLGERPPTDLDGFVDYAASLWAGDLHAIVAGAEPLGEAVTASYPANVRRRYDRLARFPERYVVIGDALCSFNPVYAQGMSVAALEAGCLAEVLDRHGLDRVGHRFFRRSRRTVDIAWTLAIDSDLRDPEVEGPRTGRWRLVNAYLDRLFPVAHRDPVVALAFLHVVGLVAPPESLMRPGIVWRVLTGGRAARSIGSHLPAPVTHQAEVRMLDR